MSWMARSPRANPWINAGALLNAFTGTLWYRLDSTGSMLQMVGRCTNTTGGLVVAFNLPVGFRPVSAKIWLQANLSAGNANTMQVSTNGDVALAGSAGHQLSLDGSQIALDI